MGVRTVEFIDRSRMDERGEPRKLVTEIWYPAQEGGAGAAYDLQSLLHPSVQAQIAGAGLQLGALQTRAVRDAAPNEAHGPYPIVLFSHGNAAVRMQSTYLTVELASHGYVVVSTDHQGNTLGDYETLDSIELGTFIGAYLDRGLDLSYLLDRLRLLRDDPLVDILDHETVGVAGHSFGALTALRMTGLDDRIDAAVPQAPPNYLLSWLDVDRPLEDVKIPIMVQGAEQDRTTPLDPDALSVWSHVTAPGYFLRLDRAGHFTFSDFCIFDAQAISAATDFGIGDIVEDGCGEANLPAEVAFPLIRRYTIGFFNVFLRESQDSLRYIETTDSADAKLEVRSN